MARSLIRYAGGALLIVMMIGSAAGSVEAAGAQGQPASGHRFTGAVSIERQPAPEGTVVRALIGNRQCGSTRTDREGRYQLDVDDERARPGCGRAGARVQFAVVPGFGDGWRVVRTEAFQSGGQTDKQIDIDLRELPGDVNNVPWLGVIWPDVRRIPVGICEAVNDEIGAAIAGALEQYRAALDYGLLTELVTDPDTACAIGGDPGIGIIATDLRDRGIIAYASPLDAELEPIDCDASAPCVIGKAAVVINTPTMLRLDPVERSNVIAHEIGHALGLAHAIRCSGGTIMWADTECRHPLSHLGGDDVAALNAYLSLGLVRQERVGGSVAPSGAGTRAFADLDERADLLANYAFHRQLATGGTPASAGPGTATFTGGLMPAAYLRGRRSRRPVTHRTTAG